MVATRPAKRRATAGELAGSAAAGSGRVAPRGLPPLTFEPLAQPHDAEQPTASSATSDENFIVISQEAEW
jgi:hypothetical protein